VRHRSSPASLPRSFSPFKPLEVTLMAGKNADLQLNVTKCVTAFLRVYDSLRASRFTEDSISDLEKNIKVFGRAIQIFAGQSKSSLKGLKKLHLIVHFPYFIRRLVHD
jgi:hypothetical protein